MHIGTNVEGWMDGLFCNALCGQYKHITHTEVRQILDLCNYSSNTTENCNLKTN